MSKPPAGTYKVTRETNTMDDAKTKWILELKGDDKTIRKDEFTASSGSSTLKSQIENAANYCAAIRQTSNSEKSGFSYADAVDLCQIFRPGVVAKSGGEKFGQSKNDVRTIWCQFDCN